MNVFTNFLSITDLYSVQTFFENHQLYLGIRKEKTEVSTVNDNISSNYFNMELFLTKWCIDTEFRHISVIISIMHPMPCMVNPYSLQTVFNGVMHNPLGLFCSTSLHLSVFHILLNSNERQRQHKSLRNFLLCLVMQTMLRHAWCTCRYWHYRQRVSAFKHKCVPTMQLDYRRRCK